MGTEQSKRAYLRQAREAAGITQTELAIRAGTSSAQIARWENGKRKLTREWAERLSPFLDVAPVWLVFGGESPTSEDDENETPAARLRDARIKSGLTQAELAQRLQTTQSQVQRLETGQRTLTWEWAQQIAPILKIDPINMFADGPIREAREHEPTAPSAMDEVAMLRAEIAILKKKVEILTDTIKRLTLG